MRTPIADFVRAYAKSSPARFHMPGHKGQSFLGCEALDITEIGGADVLYAPEGIIAESEDNATSLFGTAHTFYSAEGSSLCIKAMLALVTAKETAKGERPLILAARNAHKAFLYACALLDLDVEWLLPNTERHLCSCEITPRDVRTALENLKKAPAAVYLTTPDYLGTLCDVKGIKEVCSVYGIPLLVDNAHGAYLKFLTPSKHPIDLGADLVCDSAHKTLPVLTGGAYLHISKEAPREYAKRARAMLSLFASTSPSYLILQSLDLCNAYLSRNYSNRLSACIALVEQTKHTLKEKDWEVADTEPLKLVLHTLSYGYAGHEVAAHLKKERIEVELADATHLVLMITPENTSEELSRLESTLRALPRRAPIEATPPVMSHSHERVCSIREAILSPHVTLLAKDAAGYISAAPTVSCPPAVPIVISGERITEQDVALFAHYGIEQVDVVAE